MSTEHRPLKTAASLVSVLLAISALSLCFSPAAAANETVVACGPYGNHVFQHAAVFGIDTGQICPSPPVGGGGMEIWTAANSVAAGQRAYWQANAPWGLAIVARLNP